MHPIVFPSSESRPALGLGTWRMGESARHRLQEIEAVRLALRMGWRVIDTAEMYGEGGAEEVVGEAVRQALQAGEISRDEVFIVSKVYPHNASLSGTRAACERSLARLGLPQIDLYLLHWRGPHPLRETVAGFEALKEEGRIRHWGVSNFDRDDMEELFGVERGDRCAANQVYYALDERGIESELLPWLREQQVPCMAYSPLGKGRLPRDPTLAAIGTRHGATAAQVALAWLLEQTGVMAIPKAVREAHMRENLAAASLVLSGEDQAEIERHFPRPRGKGPLAII
jgi:diketogulonate reductase-like aldo/keto reductase